MIRWVCIAMSWMMRADQHMESSPRHFRVARVRSAIDGFALACRVLVVSRGLDLKSIASSTVGAGFGQGRSLHDSSHPSLGNESADAGRD